MHSFCAIKNLDLNSPLWILWRIKCDIIIHHTSVLYCENFWVINNGFSQIITRNILALFMPHTWRNFLECRTGKCLFLCSWFNLLLVILTWCLPSCLALPSFGVPQVKVFLFCWFFFFRGWPMYRLFILKIYDTVHSSQIYRLFHTIAGILTLLKKFLCFGLIVASAGETCVSV